MVRWLLLALCVLVAGLQIALAEAGATRSSTSQPSVRAQQHGGSASTQLQELAGNSGAVAWFVQLSDLHISKWVHPEILPDLAAFGQQVLTSVKPGAVLITGDLVDAKRGPRAANSTRRNGRHTSMPGSSWHAQRSCLPVQFSTCAATTTSLTPCATASRICLQGTLQPQQHMAAKQQQYNGCGSASCQHKCCCQNSSSRIADGTAAQAPQESADSCWQQQQLLGQVDAGSNRSNAHVALEQQPPGRATLAADTAVITAGRRDAAAAAAAAGVGGGGAACPAALLLGLDLAPNVGLHSPSHFFGVAGPALLQQLQQSLRQLRSSSSSSTDDGSNESSSSSADLALPAGCSHVPIISYSHYPFSTVAATYGSSSGVVNGGGAPAVEGGRALRDLLCRYDVRAHLSGHLHDLLGPRMRAMYDKRQLLGGVFGRSRPRAPPLQWQGGEGAGGAAGRGAAAAAFMADLESADWKERRRWRLMAVDSGAVSFADLHFRRTQCSREAAAAGACISSGSGTDDSSSSGAFSYAVTAVDASRVVTQHVVMLTWPPDGRYSPLSTTRHHQQAGRQQQTGGQAQPAADGGDGAETLLPVRALVMPLQLFGEESSKQVTSVAVEWSCQGSDADLAAGFPSRGKTLGSAQMMPVGRPAGGSSAADAAQQAPTASGQGSGGHVPQAYDLQQPQVFEAGVPLSRGELARSCGAGSSSGSAAAGVVLLQVVVVDDAGGVSSSELRPVLLPQPAALATGRLGSGQPGQQQAVAGAGAGAALAASAAGGGGAGGGGAGSVAAGGHLPLPSSTAETLLLSFDGPAFAVRLFFAGWLAQVLGLLLLPRLLGRHILALHALVQSDSSSSSSSSSSHGRLLRHQQSLQQQQVAGACRPMFCCAALQCQRSVWGLLSRSSPGLGARLGTLAAAAAGLLLRVLLWGVLQLARLVLLPLVAMAVLAQQHGGLWWALLAHSGWVLGGPWFCAQMSSSSQGLGLWFRYGLLLPLPADLSPSWVNGDAGSPFWGADAYDSVINTVSDTVSNTVSIKSDGEDSVDPHAGWQEYVWLGLPDTHLLSSLTVCITLAPMTLWLGLVVWHWHAVAAAARRSSLGGGVAAARGVAAATGVLTAGMQGGRQLVEAGKWLQQQLGVKRATRRVLQAATLTAQALLRLSHDSRQTAAAAAALPTQLGLPLGRLAAVAAG
ncbi:hypothetical protein COO60DRAFT_708840 [Scenedesmus sp. NREL 46B-D3]|nr:hypothetical protein COO60DRAFT_708840 [Scenedesmus sp. NREL 46B-D3]